MRSMAVPNTDGDVLELQLGFNSGDNGRIQSADGTLDVSFSRLDVRDWSDLGHATLHFRRDRLATTVDVDPHVARRVMVEVGRDDNVEQLAE